MRDSISPWSVISKLADWMTQWIPNLQRSSGTVLRFDVVGRSLLAIGRHPRELDPIDLVVTLSDLEKEMMPKGIVLVLRTKRLSLATAYDIDQEIKLWVEKGVKVIGFTEHLDLPCLLAISHCSERFAPPLSGPLEFRLQLRHYQLGGLTNGLGIKVFTSYEGQFKSSRYTFAEEPILERILQNDEAVLKQIYQVVLHTFQQSFRMDILSDGPNSATAVEAVAKGFLTGTAYPEFLSRLERLAFGNSLRTYSRVSPNIKHINKVHGSILPNRKRKDLVLLEINGYLLENAVRILNTFVRLGNFSNCAGILISIDSHGGDIKLVDRLWCAIKDITRDIPAVAYLRSATSGGFYVASAASRIVANPCCVLGSIGSVTFRPDCSRAIDDLGIQVLTVGYGQEPIRGSFLEPMSVAEMNKLNSRVQLAHALFVERVALGRHLPIEQVQLAADGRLFSAQEALNIGLIDSIGSFVDALRLLQRLSGLDREYNLQHLMVEDATIANATKTISDFLMMLADEKVLAISDIGEMF